MTRRLGVLAVVAVAAFGLFVQTRGTIPSPSEVTFAYDVPSSMDVRIDVQPDGSAQIEERVRMTFGPEDRVGFARVILLRFGDGDVSLRYDDVRLDGVVEVLPDGTERPLEARLARGGSTATWQVATGETGRTRTFASRLTVVDAVRDRGRDHAFGWLAGGEQFSGTVQGSLDVTVAGPGLLDATCRGCTGRRPEGARVAFTSQVGADLPQPALVLAMRPDAVRSTGPWGTTGGQEWAC